jgi:peroxiredoxin
MYMKSWIINTIIAICLATGMGFAQVPYQIEGKWATGIGKKVYLSNFPADTPEAVTIDSTIVAPDGSYKLSGKLDKMQLLSLTHEGSKGFRPLMGDGKPANILIRDTEYSYKKPAAAYEIIGNSIEHKASEAILAYWGHDFIRKMSEGMFAAGIEKSAKENNLSKKAECEEKLKAVLQERENEKNDFLSRYGNCLAAPYFIVMNLLKGIPVDETEAFYNGMGEKAKKTPKGIELKESIAKMKALAPGAKAPDFTLPTVTGEEFSLASLQGHIVILDFWASWCAPCIAEMPTVKEIYAKYKDKGLKVVGISMDNSKAAWMKSIDKIQIPWLHVSSLKGMKRCPVAELYQVYAIPKLYIIDKEGKIVDKDLRGEDLKKKVDGLFARQ